MRVAKEVKTVNKQLQNLMEQVVQENLEKREKQIAEKFFSFSDVAERLIFEPKPWTEATKKMFGIQEDEIKERAKLESQLPCLQNIWQKKALENLQKDEELWRNTVVNGKVATYIFNAVKEATQEALSGILHRYSPEDTEEFIEWALMTPQDGVAIAKEQNHTIFT